LIVAAQRLQDEPMGCGFTAFRCDAQKLRPAFEAADGTGKGREGLGHVCCGRGRRE
jgi:hypothetical protein